MTDQIANDYCQAQIKKLKDALTPVFAKASVGDFSGEVPFPDQEDEFTDFYAGVKIIMDVVREKIAELEYRMQEKEQLFASIGDGVAIVNSEGKVTYLNPSGEKLLGKTATELMLTDWSSISLELPPEETPREGVTKILTPTKYYLRPDGTRFPVMETVSTVPNPGMQIIVFRDITKEKEIEQLKTDFLSVAAHQLRTPLSNIRWNLEFLLKNLHTDLSEPTKAKLETVYEDNLMLINLVNDILSITRLSQGMIDQTTESTSIKAVTEKVMAEMQPEIERKHLTLQANLDGPEVASIALKLDPSHLYQVIQNLISNAIKYSHENQTIKLELYLKDDKIHLSVEDQGMGIPESEQADVFTRFYRATNAVNTGIGGSGLGLFVAKAFVESWKGSIWLESKEGEGTKVSFCIPVGKA